MCDEVDADWARRLTEYKIEATDTAVAIEITGVGECQGELWQASGFEQLRALEQECTRRAWSRPTCASRSL